MRLHRTPGATTASRVLVLLLVATLIPGCALWPFGKKDKNNEDDWDPDTTEQLLYQQTQRSLRAGNYDTAIQGLEQLEARFPFGRYADQAQLELIYARYMSYKHDEAYAAAERFIRLHPQHPNADYAYYLKGVTADNRDANMIDRLFSTDLSKRDMSGARQAYSDFAILLERYPDSLYAPDARQRMVYLRNLVADAELNIADYYLRRGAYAAAANRARYVVETYSQSQSVDDALAVLVEANYRLGLEDAANDALRVLAVNYPHYQAFDDDGNLVLTDQIRNRDRSWTNLVTLGLLDRPEVPPPIKLKHPEGFVPPPAPDAQSEEASEEEDGGGFFRWLPGRS